MDYIKEKYESYLRNIKYGDGYDIKIHAIQVALSILGYLNIDGVNKNDIYYGYYCVNTETMLKQFQIDAKINITSLVDRVTWNALFDELVKMKSCTIVQLGDRNLSIIGVDSLIEDSLSNKHYDASYSNHGPNFGYLGLNYPTNELSVSPNGNHIEYDIREVGANSNRLSYPVGSNFNSNDYLLNYNIRKNNPLIDDISQFLPKGFDTSIFYGNYNTNGAKHFDELVYDYIVGGGKTYTDLNYSYNISGGESWNVGYSNYINVPANLNRDYDHMYNLLANSIYNGNIDTSPLWVSRTDNNVGKYTGKYSKSSNLPYFNPDNIDELRKSEFDITIVYGAKGYKSRKILNVKPISIAQEVDASGEPVYDIYEFIAKDIIEGNN